MMKRQDFRKLQSGQGMLELILSLFAFFTIVFLYVQLSIGFAVANYIQYATFMSARALLPGRLREADQITAAKNTLDRFLRNGDRERFSAFAKGEGDGDPKGAFFGRTSRVNLRNGNARATAWEQGVTYKFSSKLYMMPLVPGAKSGKDNRVILESQSWLGRDPSEEECISTLESRKKISFGGKNAGAFIFDNGC